MITLSGVAYIASRESASQSRHSYPPLSFISPYSEHILCELSYSFLSKRALRGTSGDVKGGNEYYGRTMWGCERRC